MKKNGVLLTLLVDDYDRAFAFYVDTLGLFEIVANTIVSESERYACISLIKFVDKFMLHLKLPTDETARNSVGRQGGGNVLLTLPVDDVAALHSELIRKGVDIEREVRWRPYGGAVLLTDPFGNRISLFEHFI